MALKIKGVDISRVQADIDFAEIKKAGMKFVILRAGIGADEDTYFRKNLEQCEKYKIPFGCYWYINAVTNAEFRKEVNACIATLKGLKPEYPVFFDMEEQSQIDRLSTEERTEMAKYFCQMVEKAGFPSGIYANPSWLETYYNKSELVGKYDIWLAHWTESPDYPSRYDYGQKMWQWGIDNIGGKDVDGDICFIYYPAMTAKWYKENCGDKPENPEKPEDEKTAEFAKEDKVRVKRDAIFTNGVKPYSYVYDTVYTVQQVSASGKETLIGIDGAATGWLYTEDLYKAEDGKVTQKFSVGDKVKVNYGAKTYNGGALALFVYTNVYEVMQVGSGDRDDYIVIGQNGEITAAVRAEDLKKM